MKYIRGKRQLKALFFLIEDSLLFIIGRDTRGLDEEEKKFVVYSGKEFMMNRLLCIRRELEIFFGFAKPYKVVFAPSFWESLRNIGMDDITIEELKEKYGAED